MMTSSSSSAAATGGEFRRTVTLGEGGVEAFAPSSSSSRPHHRRPATSTPALPPSIYDAIANRDYEGLLASYAIAARNATEASDSVFERSVPGASFDDDDDDDDESYGDDDLLVADGSESGAIGIGRMGSISTSTSAPLMCVTSSPSTFFHDEKKFECPPSPTSTPPSRSILRELDDLIREIVVGCGGEGQGKGKEEEGSPQPFFPFGEEVEDEDENRKPRAAAVALPSGDNEDRGGHRHRLHHFKSTRQHSLFGSDAVAAPSFGGENENNNNPYPPRRCRRRGQQQQRRRQQRQKLRREREAFLEKVMWESAVELSNSCPDPSFAVHSRNDRRRVRRNTNADAYDEEDTEDENMRSEDNNKDDDNDENNEVVRDEGDNVEDASYHSSPPLPPLFEGTIANATPPDNLSATADHGVGAGFLGGAGGGDRGAGGAGGGRGTAQHLACAVDAPLGLAVLLALGVDPDARHTAFRRLPVHEAACADGRECLRLILEAGAGYAEEIASEAKTAMEAAEAEEKNAARGGEIADTTGLIPGGINCGTGLNHRHSQRRRSSSRDDPHPNGGGGGGSNRKVPKLKLGFFAGWHIGGGVGRSEGNSGRILRAHTTSDPSLGPSSFFSPSLSSRGETSPSDSSDGEEDRPRTSSPGEPTSSSSSASPPSFPTVLRRIWEAVRGSTTENEAEAARTLLANVGVSSKTRSILASQCGWGGTRTTFPDYHRREGGGVSAVVAPRNVDGHGNTPLHWAAFKNSVRSLDVLLSYPVRYGADANARARPSGWTPLHDAAYSDSAEAVALLLDAGAEVDARCRSGATPLCFAAQEDAPGAAGLLLEAGADPSARCLGQQSPPLAHAEAQHVAVATIRAAAAALGGGFGGGGDTRGMPFRDFGGGGGVADGRGNGGRNDAGGTPQRHAHLRFVPPHPPPPPQHQHPHHPQARFSGYTALHYCAHYNASRAARVLLLFDARRCADADAVDSRGRDSGASSSGHLLLTEIPDLNDKLPIHVAVARGSSETLRELLHGGARVVTSALLAHSPPRHLERGRRHSSPMRVIGRAGFGGGDAFSPPSAAATRTASAPVSIPAHVPGGAVDPPRPYAIVTPVSSPVLRAMIPPRPISSSKPWNCLSQKSIDACRSLIEVAELHWTPGRHAMFGPADRRAVVEVLRCGKRLEGAGTGIFADLWPCVLSFCGRGWFEASEEDGDNVSNKEMERKLPAVRGNSREQSEDVSSLEDDGEDDDQEFTQFELEGANVALL